MLLAADSLLQALESANRPPGLKQLMIKQMEAPGSTSGFGTRPVNHLWTPVEVERLQSIPGLEVSGLEMKGEAAGALLAAPD